MNKEKIQQIIMDILRDYCEQNGITVPELTTNTPLLGSRSVLDSLGLVSVIIDIESAFTDERAEVSLASESAMSARISPFRSIGSLSNYIAEQLGITD